MLPCILAFQSPSSEGHDENSNLEFIAEVRGCSETQRHSPMFIPTSQEGRGGERRRTCPFCLAGNRATRVLFPLARAQGQISWKKGKLRLTQFPWKAREATEA